MFTWTELKYKSKTCVAQLKLRVVVYSMLVALPALMALTVLQRLGLGTVADNSIRAVGFILLGLYIIGVVLIMRRTQRDHGLRRPHRTSDAAECGYSGANPIGGGYPSFRRVAKLCHDATANRCPV